MDLEKWNAIVYKDEDGKFVEGGLGAKEFWEEFQIESYPLFKNRCYYHIPEKWANDVRLMIKQIQDELGDRVTFQQIKEKFCYLTVYRKAADKEAEERAREIVADCIERLRAKGIHPARDE